MISIDLSKVVQTRSVDLLQQNLENLIFADIGEDDYLALTEPKFLQLFRISQLTLEYLVFVQNSLYSQLNHEKKEKKHVETRLESLKSKTKEKLLHQNEKIMILKKELEYQKKAGEIFERAAMANEKHSIKTIGKEEKLSSSSHPLEPSVSMALQGAESSIFSCGECSSSFISYHYLMSHYHRRHPLIKEILTPLQKQQKQLEFQQTEIQRKEQEYQLKINELQREIHEKQLEFNEKQREFELSKSIYLREIEDLKENNRKNAEIHSKELESRLMSERIQLESEFRSLLHRNQTEWEVSEHKKGLEKEKMAIEREKNYGNDFNSI